MQDGDARALLCESRKGPRSNTAKQCNEFPSSHPTSPNRQRKVIAFYVRRCASNQTEATMTISGTREGAVDIQNSF
jgi:hypothetical protein